MTYVPSVTVAIVNYNTREALRNCLSSLRRVLNEVNMTIIVVDNASSDGSLAMLESEFHDLTVLANRENVGFARAINQAFVSCTSDFFLMLNPDTWVAKNAVVRLVEMAERDPKIGVVGAQLTSFRGDTLQSVLARPNLAKEFLNLFPELKAVLLPPFIKQILLRSRERRRGEIIEVPAVSGGAMLVRSVAFKDAGGLDERFFVYHEEVDFCLRVQKLGWKVVIAPDAQVLHLEALSTGFKVNRLPSEPVLGWRLTGLAILFEKHGSRRQSARFVRMAQILLKVRALLCSLRAWWGGEMRENWKRRSQELELAAVRLSKLTKHSESGLIS